MIEKIFGKGIDFPKITLCGILLLTMIWALFIPNLTIDFSIEHLFSQTDPAVEEYFSFRDGGKYKKWEKKKYCNQ